MTDMKNKKYRLLKGATHGREVWGVVDSSGNATWIGYAANEEDAWSVALGWPDEAEINERKGLGWYATRVEVFWEPQTTEDRNHVA